MIMVKSLEQWELQEKLQNVSGWNWTNKPKSLENNDWYDSRFDFYKDVNSVFLGGNKAFVQKLFGMSKEEWSENDLDFVKDTELANYYREKDQEMFRVKDTIVNEEKITYGWWNYGWFWNSKNSILRSTWNMGSLNDFKKY